MADRVGVDVDKNGTQSGLTSELGNDPERERRNNDLGPGREIERTKDMKKRHPPVRRCNGGSRTEPRFKGTLELGNQRTLSDFTPGCTAFDDLIGMWRNPNAVAGDGRQHKTALEAASISRCDW